MGNESSQRVSPLARRAAAKRKFAKPMKVKPGTEFLATGDTREAQTARREAAVRERAEQRAAVAEHMKETAALVKQAEQATSPDNARAALELQLARLMEGVQNELQKATQACGAMRAGKDACVANLKVAVTAAELHSWAPSAMRSLKTLAEQLDACEVQLENVVVALERNTEGTGHDVRKIMTVGDVYGMDAARARERLRPGRMHADDSTRMRKFLASLPTKTFQQRVAKLFLLGRTLRKCRSFLYTALASNHAFAKFIDLPVRAAATQQLLRMQPNAGFTKRAHKLTEAFRDDARSLDALTAAAKAEAKAEATRQTAATQEARRVAEERNRAAVQAVSSAATRAAKAATSAAAFAQVAAVGAAAVG